MKRMLIQLSVAIAVFCLNSSISAQSFTPGNTYYFEHEYTGKYLCTGSLENGSIFHTWGPIPDGHQARYRFTIIATNEPGYFYLLHEYSGKYMCSGGLENGSYFHTWGPIPTGHEARYKFKIIPTEKPGYYYLLHQFSGKYVCTGGLDNGSVFHTWGPIPDGHEPRYRFKITTTASLAPDNPTTPVLGHISREVAHGRHVSADVTLFRDGTLSLKVSTKTDMAFYGMSGRVMVGCIDNMGRCIYVSDVFKCKTLCSTTDPTCKSERTDEPFLQKLPQTVGENTQSLEIYVGDDMDFHDIRKTFKNTVKLYLDSKEIVGPLANDIGKLISVL
jgi:hypothetical protein